MPQATGIARQTRRPILSLEAIQSMVFLTPLLVIFIRQSLQPGRFRKEASSPVAGRALIPAKALSGFVSFKQRDVRG
jgi:hypothetical protein